MYYGLIFELLNHRSAYLDRIIFKTILMKYHPIDNQLFIKNRAKFTAQMKSKSIAIFNSNDLFTTGADSTLPFEQSSDLF